MLNYRKKTSINLITFFLLFIFISVSTKVYAKKDKIFISDLDNLGKFEDVINIDPANEEAQSLLSQINTTLKNNADQKENDLAFQIDEYN